MIQLRVATTDDPYAEGSETFALTATVTSGNTGNASASGTATIGDEAVAGPEDTATLALAATPSVAEGGTITYTATLTNAAQTPVTVTLSSGETIAIAAGATSGSVAIAAPGEDPYLDAASVSRTISSATGGNFESLALVDPAAASTAVTDTIDVTTVSLSATASVAEGGSIVYTATLTDAPDTPVTVSLSNGATITIAAGATAGTVGTSGADSFAPHTAAIRPSRIRTDARPSRPFAGSMTRPP